MINVLQNNVRAIFVALQSNASWMDYRAAKPEMPEKLHDWLLYRHSFMKRLQCYGAESVVVQVVEQKWQKPFAKERKALAIPVAQYALTREVVIKNHQHIWMAARTVFPQQSVIGKNKQLTGLKSRSLGSVLFKNPHLQRTDFEFAQLENDLWARRSIFYIHQKPLLLCEVFFPSVALLEQANEC